MLSTNNDPFYRFKASVEQQLTALETSLRQTSPNGFGLELASHDGSLSVDGSSNFEASKAKLKENLRELSETVRVVRGNRERFPITDAELAEREHAIHELWQRLDALELSGKQPAVVDSHFFVRPGSRSRQRDTEPFASTASTGRPLDYAAQKAAHRIERENEVFLDQEQKEQRVLIEQQDQDLEDMLSVVKRLGDMGLAIRSEALRHVERIDAVDSSMSAVQSRFRQVQSRLESLIQETGRERLCSLLGLFAVFVVLLLLVLYT